ncbi:MAG: response regulator [Acidobacteriota bacterium]|nr:response regulator [Acidobacteriota bacterium]
MQKRILIIENDDEYRELIAELLIDEGCLVIQAGTLDEARRHLEERFFHLILCDIRMEDDNDEHDHSGIEFLKNEAPDMIPRVINTNYKNIENMDKSFGAAEEVVAKGESDTLLAALRKAWKKNIGMEREQSFHFDEETVTTFSRLAELLEPDPQKRPDYAEELNYIFSRMFPNRAKIRLGRVLWHEDGRVAVITHLFRPRRRPEGYIVVFGLKAKIDTEKEIFDRYKPALTGANTAKGLFQYAHTRLAALTYVTTDGELDLLINLETLFRRCSEEQFQAVLLRLLDYTLDRWLKVRILRNDVRPIRDWFDQRLRDLFGNGFNQLFNEKITQLNEKLTAFGTQFTLSEKAMAYKDGDHEVICTNPLLLFSTENNLNPEVRFVNTPGYLNGKNILTNGHLQGKQDTWLTDFFDCCLAPEFRNHLALEAMIRFDWTYFEESTQAIIFEKALAKNAFLLDGEAFSDGSIPLRRHFRTIALLRRLTQERLKDDISEAYYLGLAYHVALKILKLDLEKELTLAEARRAGHYLLACGMILNNLFNKDEVESSSANSDFVKFNGPIVTIGNRTDRVSGKRQAVLQYLYKNIGKTCSGQELGRINWPDYDDKEKNSRAKLTQLIKRLRSQFEEDIENPKIILSEGSGFQMRPPPPSSQTHA